MAIDTVQVAELRGEVLVILPDGGQGAHLRALDEVPSGQYPCCGVRERHQPVGPACQFGVVGHLALGHRAQGKAQRVVVHDAVAGLHGHGQLALRGNGQQSGATMAAAASMRFMKAPLGLDMWNNATMPGAHAQITPALPH